jgi:hypothetical protein
MTEHPIDQGNLDGLVEEQSASGGGGPSATGDTADGHGVFTHSTGVEKGADDSEGTAS